jgi:hypothetical protein
VAAIWCGGARGSVEDPRLAVRRIADPSRSRRASAVSVANAFAHLSLVWRSPRDRHGAPLDGTPDLHAPQERVEHLIWQAATGGGSREAPGIGPGWSAAIAASSSSAEFGRTETPPDPCSGQRRIGLLHS